MSPPDRSSEAGEQEMILAERALGGGRFQEAEEHLARAERLGASKHDVERLRAAVSQAGQDQTRQARLRPWIGFGLGLLGYLLLSVRQPPEWSIPIWAALAFLLVPGLAGWVAGAGVSAEDSVRRFGAGMRAGGGAMALYCALSLMLLHRRIGTEGSDAFLVGLFVTLVYAALAGSVAGLVSTLPARGRSPESLP